MAGTRLENGQHQNSSLGITVGTERFQEKIRTTKEELGRRHQTRPQEYGFDLGRSRGTGERKKQNGIDASGCWMN